LESRGIDVAEVGRRFDEFHKQITGKLGNRVHAFQDFGELKTRAELRDQFAEAKISVCFPRSVTHPERAQGVETVTHRYFESMASGCIVFGHCPAELEHLFGYNPVIEMDGNPIEQIQEILGSVGNYQWLVSKNLETISRLGFWDHRMPMMEIGPQYSAAAAGR
jgi:hypothetical protein